MIKYTLPVKIAGYSDSVAKVSLEPNKRPDLSVLNRSNTLNMVKTASKVVKIAPKEDDFLYVRVRAVSAGNVIEHDNGYAELVPMETLMDNLAKYGKQIRGANDNGDFFSYDELKKTYKTFIGKAAFVDHQNENVEEARGIILDSIWNERGKFVELLIAVDKKAFPELTRGIEMGYITDVSMGCRCGKSICSVCKNEAITEEDFCDHIISAKGREIDNKPVFEDNREIEFFEISFVSQGADKQAKILEKVASKGAPRVAKMTTSNPYEAALLKVASEKNRRHEGVEFKSFKDQLNNLPWS
ncbi:MAG: hypothetical protein K0R18_476 [Bacillales bacterium]|jgi:hypothetical protein|nr:hypothetical protein [Bacillales bacterium]